MSARPVASSDRAGRLPAVEQAPVAFPAHEARRSAPHAAVPWSVLAAVPLGVELASGRPPVSAGPSLVERAAAR
jgi:hypothetical protein